MHGELFDSTIPFGEPELLKAVAYQRYLENLEVESSAAGARMSQLSPSLQADLGRAELRGSSSEAVEVIAACIRHSSRVTIHFQCADRVLPLTVFPQERLVHCPMEMDEVLERHLPGLRVMHVEPATLRPPGDATPALVGDVRLYHPLTPFLWAVALRGPRRELLPEISGPAVYRLAPSLDIQAAPVTGAVRATILRLRGSATSLAAIASWPGFDRERAARLLNALYLQSGLIVSRSHPAAVKDSWFGR
ncbi:MAG: hypothetical protein M3O01_12540 [Pseudomonadota bacterium]|nr:hypothetical protein [Pseudomonadota bacterium]